MVTRAVLRLFPIPQARLLEGWAFDDFAAGFEAINALLQAGIRPGLLEYGDDDPSADCDPLAALYVSYEGPETVARAEAQAGQEVCLQSGGQMLDPSEVQHFWDQRHASGDAYAKARRAGERRSRPEIDYVHVALPPSAVLAYRRVSLKLLASRGFHVHQTGLWVHAGLFSLVYSGGGVTAMAEAHARLLELAQDAGGAMEYCHGVGLRLAPLHAPGARRRSARPAAPETGAGPERHHESGESGLVGAGRAGQSTEYFSWRHGRDFDVLSYISIRYISIGGNEENPMTEGTTTKYHVFNVSSRSTEQAGSLYLVAR